MEESLPSTPIIVASAVAPAPVQSVASQTPLRKIALVGGMLLCTVVVGLFGLWVYISYYTNYAIVGDQNYFDVIANNRIYIKKLLLKKKGFIQIYFANQYNKPDNNASITRPDVLYPDVYSDFYLRIVMNPDGEKKEIQRGDTLYAVVREDTNNDGIWGDIKIDRPLNDWLGRPLNIPFRVK